VSDVELLFLGEMMDISDEFKDCPPVRPALLRFGGVFFFGEELLSFDVYILSYRKNSIRFVFILHCPIAQSHGRTPHLIGS
jgi:hypothetical protein